MGCVISVHTEKRWEGNGGGGSVQLPAGRETTALLAALEPACRSIFIRCNIQHAADRRQTPSCVRAASHVTGSLTWM